MEPLLDRRLVLQGRSPPRSPAALRVPPGPQVPRDLVAQQSPAPRQTDAQAREQEPAAATPGRQVHRVLKLHRDHRQRGELDLRGHGRGRQLHALHRQPQARNAGAQRCHPAVPRQPRHSDHPHRQRGSSWPRPQLRDARVPARPDLGQEPGGSSDQSRPPTRCQELDHGREVHRDGDGGGDHGVVDEGKNAQQREQVGRET
mmetsp:Transcript_51161/g.159830  ORF Transcript_51161/g.159830 Transcript_51161/m.159830 type:complete len:202 (-) Transcript_51161:948-1553(-)